MGGSSKHLPVFSSFFLHSSVPTAPPLAPLQPLPAGFCTSLALPVPGLAPQPLPAACAPGTVTPPALIRPATPSPASSFFRSLLFIRSSLFRMMGSTGSHRKKLSPPILSSAKYIPKRWWLSSRGVRGVSRVALFCCSTGFSNADRSRRGRIAQGNYSASC